MHLEIGISAGCIGHRFQSHRGRHPNGIAAKEAEAHEQHLRVSASVPCCQDFTILL